MFVVANRNIILPSADGAQEYLLPRGYIGSIPDWAAATPYFAALVQDGKIGVPEGRKDAEVERAAKAPARKKKGSAESVESVESETAEGAE